MKKVSGMKKWVAAVLALVLCFAVAGSALASGYGVISNTSSLNLRASGSSSSQWLGAYNRGTWVEIVGSQNNFYRVVLPDGKTGYMSKNYINTQGNSPETVRIATVSNPNGGSYLNFRTQPSYNASVYGILYNGTPLLVLGQQNGWYYVQLNGIAGYVRSEYVKVSSMFGSSDVAVVRTGNGGGLNLRTGPGKHYPAMFQISNRQYVMVLAKGNGWWRVAVNGYVGFTDASYLKTLTLDKAPAASAGSSSSTGSSSSSAKPYAVVNNPKATQALNLRQYPSTAAAVLRKLYNGTELWVTDHGSEWCAVTMKDTGVSGYVMTKYIKLLNLPSAAARTVSHPNGSFVNLRMQPSLNATVLLRVPHGKKVNVLSTGSEWCKVNYNGVEGYMLDYFLK
jgi:N-acetylmuramoyl-L-alanine amidase